MPRGGKRPGAGAPKGNTNAFKHGRNSKRLRALALALAQIPEARDMAIAQHRLQKRRERQAQKIIEELLLFAFLRDPIKFNQNIASLPSYNPFKSSLQKKLKNLQQSKNSYNVQT